MTDDLDLQLKEAEAASAELARLQKLSDDLPKLKQQKAERDRKAEAEQVIETTKANIESYRADLVARVKARDQTLHRFIQLYLELLSRMGEVIAIDNKLANDIRQIGYQALVVRGEIQKGQSIPYQSNLVDLESNKVRHELGLERPARYSTLFDNNIDVQRLLAFLGQVINLDVQTTPVARESIDNFRVMHSGLTHKEEMRQASMNPNANGNDAHLFEPP